MLKNAYVLYKEILEKDKSNLFKLDDIKEFVNESGETLYLINLENCRNKDINNYLGEVIDYDDLKELKGNEHLIIYELK